MSATDDFRKHTCMHPDYFLREILTFLVPGYTEPDWNLSDNTTSCTRFANLETRATIGKMIITKDMIQIERYPK